MRWPGRAAEALQVVGAKAGPPADADEHPGADLFAVMKGEHEVRPAVALKDTVGTGSALDAPADAFQGCQDATGP